MAKEKQKVLVTGAAGFIGFHITKKLLENGNEVIGIDNINDYYDINLKYARLTKSGISIDSSKSNSTNIYQSELYPNYKFVKMDIEDREQLYELFSSEKFDKVCHLAAQVGVRYSLENPHAYVGSNLIGFVNIIEACRQYDVKHLVYASSSSVYGDSKAMSLKTSSNVDRPISLYAATKKSNELIAHTYSHLYNLPTTGLRFFTVYGPWGRPDMAYFIFVNNILNGIPIKIYNGGDMYRDFTYIDDIVEGIKRVIEITADTRKSVPYKLYNIGNSSTILLLDFIKQIEKSLGKNAIKEFLPIQPGDVHRTEADISDLKKDYNYKPDTPLDKGINEFVLWYKSYFQ